ncbi:hypothetical protein HCX48_00380 [Rhodocyclus tenuis]|uniref:Uncharacterized protein n=1 Tax=Rhodocyclus gracilis TaxID=2929842 RepID=A0ABX0WDB9_9RHOO|nr:hypothetical protein [Rhodocyclus gracilis]MRD73314.1 hypothetical protein [Rhodocyclus gracilis]NJA87685.1 hypothetical protein [Rhodocyclus gracilis]
MFIFSDDGREAFLKLVSRLSGQVLLLAPCFFITKLPKFTWSEPIAWIVMLWLGVLYFFASGAAMIEFLEASKKSEDFRKISEDVSASGAKGFTYFWQMLKRTPWREFISFGFQLFIALGCTFAVLAYLAFSFSHA